MECNSNSNIRMLNVRKLLFINIIMIVEFMLLLSTPEYITIFSDRKFGNRLPGQCPYVSINLAKNEERKVKDLANNK